MKEEMRGSTLWSVPRDAELVGTGATWWQLKCEALLPTDISFSQRLQHVVQSTNQQHWAWGNSCFKFSSPVASQTACGKARLADLVPRPGRNQVATSGWPLLLCPALEAAACAAPSSLAASFYSSLSQCCSCRQPVLPPRASPGCAAARGSPLDARGLCKKWVSSGESPFWMLPALICENPLAVS